MGEFVANRPQVFKGEDGQWYWRLVAGNGQVVATGGEGFTERNDAVEAMTDAITKTDLDAVDDGK